MLKRARPVLFCVFWYARSALKDQGWLRRPILEPGLSSLEDDDEVGLEGLR
jgi:hypothetical protein